MINGRVAAVVMTHNRCDRVRRWLECIAAQTRPPDGTIVIDNGSDDGTGEMVAKEYPGVRVVRSEYNTGSAGCGQLAVEAAMADDFDRFITFDDDAFPCPDAIERTLAAADDLTANGAKLGMMWMPFSELVGWRWNGNKTPVLLSKQNELDGKPVEVDLIDMNMTLVTRELVDQIGLPRGDFFMMMWANEYCLRAKRAGFVVCAYPKILCTHEHAGSTGGGEWRTYYQTRNHVQMVLERRSPKELFHCAMRQGRFIGSILLRPGRKSQRLRYRFSGIWDGIRGVRGRTVEPAGEEELIVSKKSGTCRHP